jgi:hypothetical protein
MKRRLPCLSRTIRFELRTTLILIVAAAVVHNMCIKERIAMPADRRLVRQVRERKSSYNDYNYSKALFNIFRKKFQWLRMAEHREQELRREMC